MLEAAVVARLQPQPAKQAVPLSLRRIAAYARSAEGALTRIHGGAASSETVFLGALALAELVGELGKCGGAAQLSGPSATGNLLRDYAALPEARRLVAFTRLAARLGPCPALPSQPAEAVAVFLGAISAVLPASLAD